MSQNSTHKFPLVDRQLSIRMGVDFAELEPGRIRVVESTRRLRKEQSYGYLRALWWMWLQDGRTAISVPPGAGEGVRAVAREVEHAEELCEPALAERLKPPVSDVLCRAGLQEVDRSWWDVTFACNRDLLRRHRCGDCRRLTDESIPPAEGLSLPTHCFPDGICYAVVEDGEAVSIAFSHRTGIMEDRIADPGVGTAPPYRRRGYAKTVVSAVVEQVTRRGGEARYSCSPDNQASIATARSVGFVPYGRSLVLGAPAPDPGGP
ncbi:MAG: GNAT family N-acetyltransferase [Candidatus Brocadiaceae bacterium]|jgi:GNAT superfamily N-acetyltransferase